jgi:hypothetical protein
MQHSLSVCLLKQTTKNKTKKKAHTKKQDGEVLGWQPSILNKKVEAVNI